MAEILTQTLGYPRIGADRELKKALEGHWRGKVTADELLETFRAVQKQSAEAQLAANIDRIGVGDGTLYDHVLDWTIRLGFIPDRFCTARKVSSSSSAAILYSSTKRTRLTLGPLH